MKLKGHSISTDNASIVQKVNLRKKAIEGIENVRVLDLFAGENRIWSNFALERYYGVEKEAGKGKNLWADNRKIIPSMDLSQFNVIDVDSYGIPFEQIEMIFENPSLQPGTMIIYTAITNGVSTLSKKCQEMYGIQKMYKKCKTAFNKKALDYFHGMLYKYGVRHVFCYNVYLNFTKEYGYFCVDTQCNI